ncbi:MAG: hypothetical protein JNK58_10670 [Phycisphaerae bacterium]|nr:hypothetical protein [Phycisphaerae bacterium]
MKLVLLFNPRSGSGAAQREAELFAHSLSSAGHGVRLVPIEAWTSDFSGADALVVMGGDGTVHLSLDAAIDSGTPVYHVPMGTENLFAREFGMDRRPATLLSALEGGRIKEVDIARGNGRAFVIMCGVGPDASIVHRMARRRGRTISHLSYLGPIFAEFGSPALAPIRVTIDGREAIAEASGWLVVANSRQYALRLDPARDADMTDGLLDIVFFPGRSIWTILAWTVLAWTRRQHWLGSFFRARGREVRIECLSRPLPLQLDGEAGPHVGRGDEAVRISVDPRRLRVLTPVSR